MKKILKLSLITLTALIIFSCAKEKKVESTENNGEKFHINAANSSVEWTAYKTTDKLPVKGTFTEINILKSSDGNSPTEALEGVEFEIPVSSIFTKDTLRDGKLNKFFFEVMKNTMSLKGTFSVTDKTNGNLALTMNGLTEDLPFSYEMRKDTIVIDATMDLNIWQAKNAVESLHEACLALHTGPDGVSKTWEEVAISAKILTEKK